MSKVRVYEVAKQLNLDPKQVVALFQQVGINDVRNHMSSVEPEQVERVKRHLEKQKTHDVVEERVRTDGRVVKRRAVAKPATDFASAPAICARPSAPASSRDVARRDAAASPVPAGLRAPTLSRCNAMVTRTSPSRSLASARVDASRFRARSPKTGRACAKSPRRPCPRPRSRPIARARGSCARSRLRPPRRPRARNP